MTSALLQELLKQLAVLGALLLLGMILRAKIPLFRKLLLPASVIGGGIGLLLGPLMLGDFAALPFSEESIGTWAALPGVLIVPIFASVPLGNGFEEVDKKNKSSLGTILTSCGLFSVIREVQLILGFGFTVLVMSLFPKTDLYRTFGFELSQGFSGGHGTAAGVGSILNGYELAYWETAQGVATTFATIGLIGGMLLGIWIIHMATKKGETRILKKPVEMPKTFAYGFTKNVNEQPSLGRETTNNSSIESLTVHLAVILIDCGLAYWVVDLAKAYQIPGLSAIPVWFVALILMYGINALIKGLKLQWMFDKRVKAKIVGAISDFAIVAAMVSIPVDAIVTYIVPIILLSALGFVVTYVLCFPLYKAVFGKENYYFERAILTFGVNTGVTINGMMLLKICDPEYDSPALNDFSVAFALMSIISLFTFPVMYSFIQSGSTIENLLFAIFTASIYIIMTIVGKVLMKKEKRESNG